MEECSGQLDELVDECVEDTEGEAMEVIEGVPVEAPKESKLVPQIIVTEPASQRPPVQYHDSRPVRPAIAMGP